VAPASPLQTFRDAALRSGLISRERWAAAVSEVGAEPAMLADHLVALGIFTRYQAQQLQAGRGKLTLGPYQITDWIGQGGMGQVFKAVHSVMGRQCAVKVLPMEKSTTESRESFLREIRLQAGLDCPYLVRAYDAGHDGNVHYLVTEYVPGTDLRRLVRQGGQLTMSSAANVIRQAALGLHYAHGLGLIHRDVKPGNILVNPDGHAKVSDVGLAAWMGMADDPRAGKIVGTADYLSPEQIRTPRDIGPASDIYSLGCTLYYAVTGKVPFPGGDAREKCRRHLDETPWHPRRLAPDLSEDLVELIAEMMEKDPQRRIGSALLVAERLLPWCDGQPERFPASTGPSPWMPAPPPAELAAADHPTDREPASQSSMEYPRAEPIAIGSLPKGASLSETRSMPPPLPTSLPGWAGTEGSGLAPAPLGVAWVLAIVIPICLFVGAVIGFLVRGQMQRLPVVIRPDFGDPHERIRRVEFLLIAEQTQLVSGVKPFADGVGCEPIFDPPLPHGVVHPDHLGHEQFDLQPHADRFDLVADIDPFADDRQPQTRPQAKSNVAVAEVIVAVFESRAAEDTFAGDQPVDHGPVSGMDPVVTIRRRPEEDAVVGQHWLDLVLLSDRDLRFTHALFPLRG